MELTIERAKEAFQKLPDDLRKTLLSEDFGLIIQLIGGDVGITPEKALDVEDEVTLVLMGFSHPKDFVRNIQSKIGVDEQKARAIAEKVNEEIFQPVKESLKIVHNIKDEGAPATTPVTPPVPPMAPKPPTPSGTPSSFPQMIVPTKINLEIPPKPPAPPAKISPGENLSGQATYQQSQNIFEQKLQGVFKMPKEETLVPQKPSSSPTPPTPPRTGGVDPYREPAA